MDSDKVIVMDTGSAVEFNHPYILLQNTESIFYGLVKETGKAMAEHLIEIAQKVTITQLFTLFHRERTNRATNSIRYSAQQILVLTTTGGRR